MGISAASAGAVKVRNLCFDAAWFCSGIDTEMSSCIFSGSQRGWFESWNAGETMLQGSKMQGSSGSTEYFHLLYEM